jgi:hypothetical protein
MEKKHEHLDIEIDLKDVKIPRYVTLNTIIKIFCVIIAGSIYYSGIINRINISAADISEIKHSLSERDKEYSARIQVIEMQISDLKIRISKLEDENIKHNK